MSFWLCLVLAISDFWLCLALAINVILAIFNTDNQG